MKEIFISHSSADKEIVDSVIDFMLRCGIPAKKVFCSSVSGNGVEQRIPDEVKQAINESKVNIAVLSDSYYRSAYCQNEAGIIWYQQQDIPAIIIALPEITHKNMQGFLNGDNIVRRLDNRQHIMEIADIIKSQCDDFDCNVAKMSANVDKLIKEYNGLLQSRTLPETEASTGGTQDNVSDLEQRIMSNDFSDGELVFLKYFYDTDDREVLDDMLFLNQWYLSEDYSVPMGDIPLITLKEEKIVEEIFDEKSKGWVGYRLTLPYYRQLRKISPDCYSYICNRLKEHAVESKGMEEDWNAVDWYVHNELTDIEKLLLQYVWVNNCRELGAGWKATQEIDKIKAWEDALALSYDMSQHYAEILNRFVDRKWLVVSEVTSQKNPRQYKWTDAAQKMIFNLHEDSKRLLRETVKRNQVF